MPDRSNPDPDPGPEARAREGARFRIRNTVRATMQREIEAAVKLLDDEHLSRLHLRMLLTYCQNLQADASRGGTNA